MVDLIPYVSPDLAPLWKLLLSLAIGLMVGFEREIAQEKMTNVKFAGLRTFGLAGLIGGVTAYLASNSYLPADGTVPAITPNGYFIIGVVLLAIMGLLTIAYYRSTGIQQRLGFTTEISVILTFLMGCLAFLDPGVAIILAVMTTIILAFKQPLHEFTHRIPKEEFYDSLLFALIAIVILPILPNRDFGLPYPGFEAIFNPQEIWLFVVFISGVSYIGYFLVKWLGPQTGLAITGIVGGIASSTAVTTTMATQTKRVNGMENEATMAATLANMVMLIRVVILVLLINPGLLAYLGLPIGAMLVAGLVVAGYFYLKGARKGRESETIRLRSPFSIRPALTFAALIAAILFVSKTASVYLGNLGLYTTALFAGLADVDAITISASTLASGGATLASVAVIAILIGVFVNLLIRIVYAYYFGTPKFGANTIVMAAAIVSAGLVASLFMLSGALG
ncbi:MAG: MgtC family protein [Methanocella sp. PtaU1.Bin125]|nr:MAG: MgtC family protein [Methanocella sp. PtaU1.Bin125]